MTSPDLYQPLACTRKITVNSQPVDNCVQNTTSRSRHAQFIHMLDLRGMLSGESPSGAYREPLKRLARGVAIALVGAMSFGAVPADGISEVPNRSSKELIKYVANKQLSDNQYKCHNEIIYRESRWNDKAIGNKQGTKQAYGLYQLKIASMKDAHVELQFWKYWQYVSYRYGVTALDEPDYCVALDHLKSKGWQ